MSEFFGLLKLLVLCGACLLLAMMVLLALPKSRLRTVGIEVMKWAVVAGLAVLTVSPLDLIPFLPVDDAGYVLGAIVAARSALRDRKQRLLLDA